MRYEFHPEALEEYRQAALWYSEREPELALQFIGSVEDAIKRVADTPSRWRVIERGCPPLPHSSLPIRTSLHNRDLFLTHCGGHALQSRARLLEVTNRQD